MIARQSSVRKARCGSKPEVAKAQRHVRSTTDSRDRHDVSGPFRATSKVANYSITSSALSSREVGMARPNAMAVLRLSTNLNLVTCSIGMSAGLVPLRILVHEHSGATNQIKKI